MFRITTDTQEEALSIKEAHKHTCIMNRHYCEIEEGNCFKCAQDNICLQCNGQKIEMED